MIALDMFTALNFSTHQIHMIPDVYILKVEPGIVVGDIAYQVAYPRNSSFHVMYSD